MFKDEIVLWEILVPENFPEGNAIPILHHQEWDEMVRRISGGLTIHKNVKGQWISSDRKLIREPMIPVRISCTEPQIQEIADLTAKHYRQIAVMYYVISEKVFIQAYNPDWKRI